MNTVCLAIQYLFLGMDVAFVITGQYISALGCGVISLCFFVIGISILKPKTTH